MARTYKDMPERVLETMPSQRWRFAVGGWPMARTGAWGGQGEWFRYFNVRQRRYVKALLHKGIQPEVGYRWPCMGKRDIW